MKQDTPVERDLVLRFARGDHSAFKDIYDHYCKPLALFAKTYTLNIEEAANITMNRFERLWQKHTQFNSLYQVRGFLWLTAKHAGINWARKLVLPVKVSRSK